MVPLRALIRAILVISITFSFIAAGVSAVDSGEFDMSIPGSIDTPDRTVSVEGDTYHISTIAARTPGTNIPVDVTAPESTEYKVQLYDSDGRIVDVKRGSGSERVSLEPDGQPPGTYVVSLYIDGTIEKVQPVVLEGYTLSVDIPETAAPESTLDVSVTVRDDEQNGAPAGVDVILVDGNDGHRVDATKEGDGTYSASLSLTGLSEGTYSVYATAHGTEQVYGQDELLGITSPTTFQIAEDTPTETTTEPNDGSGEQTSESTETTQPPTTSTTTPPSDPLTTEPTPTPTPEPTTEPTPTPTPTETTTDESVITPEFTNESTTETQGQPGFGFLTWLGSLVGTGLLYWRHERT